MNRFEYLLFNVVILFLSSLAIIVTKRGRFPEFKTALVAILSVSIPYLIWDAFVTNWWWEFNPRFLTGFAVGPLPIEEVLFFAVVPWSCLVIWVNLKIFFIDTIRFHIEEWVIGISSMIFCVSLVNTWWYTVAISMLLILFAAISKMNNGWLRHRNSLLFLAICFGLICLFNGYLTARPIVVYNRSVKSNLDVFTIPIEDIGYGLVLVGFIAQSYEYFSRKKLGV